MRISSARLFGALENRVEVVVVVDLGHAVPQEPRVGSPLDELRPQAHRAAARLAEGLSLLLGAELAGVVDVEAGERELNVDLLLERVERGRRLVEADRGERLGDERQHAVPAAIAALARHERIE